MNKFSREIVDEILSLYKSGEKVTVIAAKFNTSSSYISHIANKHGLTRQTHKASGGAKACPKCRKKIEVKGARFCPFCASDIRSSREIAIDKLMQLRKIVSLIPANCQAEFEDALNTAVKELSV